MTDPDFDPDFDPDDEQDTNGTQQKQRDGHDLRQLRKKAKEHDRLVEENQTLKRQLAFGSITLPDSPVAQLFRDKYDGDLTPEAVTAAAVKYGLVEAAPDPLQQQLEAHERLSNAAAGASPAPGQITPDDVAAWPTDKAMRFAKQHPDAWESLKQGDPVSGITF